MKKVRLSRDIHSATLALVSLGAMFRANILKRHAKTQQEVFAVSAITRIQQANAELAGLKIALASSQHQLRDAQNQIDTLADANARCRRELGQLAHETAEVRLFCLPR